MRFFINGKFVDFNCGIIMENHHDQQSETVTLPDPQALIEAMKAKRLGDHLSIRALSQQIGISFSSLSRMERGDGEPSLMSKAKIVHWLGMLSDDQLQQTIQAALPAQRVNWLQHIEARLERIETNSERILELLAPPRMRGMTPVRLPPDAEDPAC